MTPPINLGESRQYQYFNPKTGKTETRSEDIEYNDEISEPRIMLITSCRTCPDHEVQRRKDFNNSYYGKPIIRCGRHPSRKVVKNPDGIPGWCARNKLTDTYESGYDRGHNDTVEGCVVDPKVAAEEYLTELKDENHCDKCDHWDMCEGCPYTNDRQKSTIRQRSNPINATVTEEEPKQKLLKEWFKAVENCGGVSKAHNGYAEGIERGLEIACDLHGITEGDRTAYWNTHWQV